MSQICLFYGNCQLGALSNTLKLSNEQIYIPCWTNEMTEEEFTAIIKKADIIITQPINNNYKDKFYFSTEYIIKTCKESTKIFIFPSLHFEFYYPDLMYRVLNDGSHLNEPSPYHYKSIIDNFSKGIDYILENCVDNKNYKTEEELFCNADNSITELNSREELIDKYGEINAMVIKIKVSHFIKEHFQQKLLFYSMNHPTPYILQYISEFIKDILSFGEINYDFDGLAGSDRCILYSCIQKCVEFDLTLHTCRLNKYNLENKIDIIKKYIECYSHQ